MNINWYPGHMVKAKRAIEENIKMVDMVVMLLDARAPFSCRNPELEKIARRKKIVIVLNKADLAAPASTKAYIKRLIDQGLVAVAMDSISGRGQKEVIEVLRKAYQDKADIMISKGNRVRPARVMITGVPNIGKSTFLNTLVRQKAARTGAKPGITRGKQWVRVRDDIEFMDTPGLMWPKIDNTEQGLKLALLNIIGENAYEEEKVALYLINILQTRFPEVLSDYYKVTDLHVSSEEILEQISRKRGHLLKGGSLDLEKTCKHLLIDYRSGTLGRISLDDDYLSEV
ncbi:MAG: ribosome biogenesis GTPase YlqF [Syntrophomonadaceae bacterium]|nr:ribosome biogenesis GTPase YlqF [Syntrophomonadaceae bacterium]